MTTSSSPGGAAKMLVLAVAPVRTMASGSPALTASPSSATSTSGSSCQSGDSVDPARSPLHIAFAIVESVAPATIPYSNEFETTDLRQDLSKIETIASGCTSLVGTAEDIRQVLHPAVAALRSNDGSKSPSLSEFFYNFVNAEPLLLALYSSDYSATVNTNNNNECPVPSPTLGDTPADRVRSIVAALRQADEALFESHRETIQEGYTSGVCVDSFVDNGLVVRTRGLPWQASDQDVALFFAGLNIAAGGVALCLSPDGRRNGEALVRFETRAHREMALARHRHFLHSRYIEVYRATGEDFLKVAVGSDQQAVQFASREAAMIVRMRGLPFDCSEPQIHAFFAADGEPSGIADQGILFVTRPDGRPSGDAFVLFADESAGRRALLKHKNRIGARYIELFRTTQAEVQQVFNRTMRASPPVQMPGNGAIGPVHMPKNVMNGLKRDCIRLRGLPYEAAVKDVAQFMGAHARHIAFHGVHMIYNNQGHPSGECFIQMDAEQSAAAAAHSMHNKYMEIGKKKRYIEVFQCSAEEITAILNSSAATQQQPPAFPQISPTSTVSSSTTNSNVFPSPQAVAAAAAALMPPPPQMQFRPAGLLGAHQPPGMQTTFYHPALAQDPQLLFAAAQFGQCQFPIYTQEQLQLAASHQLDINQQALLAAAAAHQPQFAFQSVPGLNGDFVEMVPMTAAPPLTLIHT
uniref:RRM domain-containing protein n=1 Tax=Panagrellus redivivus TaxID=6233 RepID=A0A7E4V9X7_PANRE